MLGITPEGIQNLNDLKEACKTCQNCGLSIGRMNTVFARGNPYSRIVVLGEAPGADEDASGLPFVGRAGQLLDRMFASVGLGTATDLYLINTIRCRPPGNRVPTDDETLSCKPWTEDTIELIQPRFIVAAGSTALKWCLGIPANAAVDASLKITQARGKWHTYKHPTQGDIPVIPIFHPSYLLRLDPDWDNPTSPHSRTFQDMKTIAHARSTSEFVDSAELGIT